MSGWSDWASLAKSAIDTAQKKIDKALDIQENEGAAGAGNVSTTGAASSSGGTIGKHLQDEFFTAFGLKNEAEQSGETPLETGESSGTSTAADIASSAYSAVTPSFKQLSTLTSWLPAKVESLVPTSKSSDVIHQTDVTTADTTSSSLLSITTPTDSRHIEEELWSTVSASSSSAPRTSKSKGKNRRKSAKQQQRQQSDLNVKSWLSTDADVAGNSSSDDELAAAKRNDLSFNAPHPQTLLGTTVGDSMQSVDLVVPQSSKPSAELLTDGFPEHRFNVISPPTPKSPSGFSSHPHSAFSKVCSPKLKIQSDQQAFEGEVPNPVNDPDSKSIPVLISTDPVDASTGDPILGNLENIITPVSSTHSAQFGEYDADDGQWQSGWADKDAFEPHSTSGGMRLSLKSDWNDENQSESLIAEDLRTTPTPSDALPLAVRTSDGTPDTLLMDSVQASPLSPIDVSVTAADPSNQSLTSGCATDTESQDAASSSTCTILETSNHGSSAGAGRLSSADRQNSGSIPLDSSGSPSRELSSNDLLATTSTTSAPSPRSTNHQSVRPEITSGSSLKADNDHTTAKVPENPSNDPLLETTSEHDNPLHHDTGDDEESVVKTVLETMVRHVEPSGSDEEHPQHDENNPELPDNDNASLMEASVASSFIRVDVSRSEDDTEHHPNDSSSPDSSPPLPTDSLSQLRGEGAKQLVLGRKSSGVSEDTNEEGSSICHLAKGSGYTSPDDVESCALSSDIEILSNPTPNGDNGSERSFRSTSGFTPQHSHHHGLVMGGRHQHHTGSPSKHMGSGKDSGEWSDLGACSSNDVWRQKVAHLTEILTAREKSIIQLSTANARLQDENMVLKKAKVIQASNQKSDSEASPQSLHILTREVNTLREKLAEQGNLQKKVNELERTNQTKDEEIQQLMQEGQKLAMQELKQSNIIKKLREQEKETAKLLESQKTKLKEFDDVKKKAKSLEEQLKLAESHLYKSEGEVEKQERISAQYEDELEDVKDKCASFKLAVEKCYKEIADNHKTKALLEAEIEHLKSSIEQSKHEEFRENLEKEKSGRTNDRQSYLQQIEDLRISLVHANEEHSRREESLRWDITQAQKKLQEAEIRNEELSETASTATKPLLRQIESLQVSFKAQQNNWERVEKSLYDRITEAERKAAAHVESEATINRTILDFKAKVAELESQVNNLTSRNNRLTHDITRLSEENQRSQDKTKR